LAALAIVVGYSNWWRQRVAKLGAALHEEVDDTTIDLVDRRHLEIAVALPEKALNGTDDVVDGEL
jgi:hypothetical protein